MPKPPQDWIERLPTDHCIAEFSIWSANLMNLSADLERISPHADILHLDVADGHFAPAMLIFPDMVAALRDQTELPLHIHLMVADSVLLSQIEQFAEAGADLISFHVENKAVAEDAFALLEQLHIPAGLVARVETPVVTFEPYVEKIQFLTLLGTAIGVKGQGLDAAAPARLGEAQSLIADRESSQRCVLAADGGIREHTVPDLVAAGAETVVLGSLAFGADDLRARMSWLAALQGSK